MVPGNEQQLGWGVDKGVSASTYIENVRRALRSNSNFSDHMVCLMLPCVVEPNLHSLKSLAKKL